MPTDDDLPIRDEAIAMGRQEMHRHAETFRKLLESERDEQPEASRPIPAEAVTDSPSDDHYEYAAENEGFLGPSADCTVDRAQEPGDDDEDDEITEECDECGEDFPPTSICECGCCDDCCVCDLYDDKYDDEDGIDHGPDESMDEDYGLFESDD